MWWLIRARMAGTRERGAMAVLVALLVPVVLLGLGAFVVDVGSWYAERAQTQNGADAGAVAVAQSCAKGVCSPATASPYAPANSTGNLNTSSVVRTVCGASDTGGLTACDPASENGKLCPPTRSGNYVDVQVTTDKTMTPIFGSVLGGTSQTIGACAQATWAAARGGSGLALTMSICNWLADTGAAYPGDPNAQYATPQPPYPADPWPAAYPGTVSGKAAAVPNIGGENVFQVTGKNKCSAGESGLDVPGGFGWLSDSSNGQAPPGCLISTDANGYVYSNPGGIGGQSSDCSNYLKAVYAAGPTIPNSLNPIFIPIFDLACGSDGRLQPDDKTACPAGMPSSSYHVIGYAEFVLTGYDYNPIHAASMINGADPCKGGSTSCLYGLFTTGLIPNGQVCTTGGCPNLGASVVQLTG